MSNTKRTALLAAGCLGVALFAVGLGSTVPAFGQAAEPVSKTCREGPRAREIEIQKIEPFKMFDNLYHVGPCYVAAYLLTTPQGVIMFDTTQEPFVDKLIENINKVGVNPRDIKYIIINHGHIDHFGGAARMQELTGAHVVAIAEDWTMIEAADGKTNNRDPAHPNRVPKIDIVAHEGDHIDLGDQHLIIHTAPGHTPGNMFVEGIVLKEGGQTYKAIWGGGGGGVPGIEGAKQGVINAQKVAAVKGVQVYMMTHSWQPPNGYPGGGIHERAVLLKARKPGDPNPFVDSAAWQNRVQRQLAAAQKTLADEQAKAGTR
jgi:metallo-beta-lactamase class B